MTAVETAPVSFLSRAERDMRDERLRAAVRNATTLMAGSRGLALDGLADPDALRTAARTLRAGVLAELPAVLDEWSTRLEALGGHVHWAADGAEATAIVRELVGRHGTPLVAKGKSMASEEIHLNEVLEADGCQVIETDLGEFIIQLAKETPSHIIAPAIHHDRYTVADLFTEDAGRPVEADITAEASYAQARLRASFLAAGVGLSGVNFAVAETGSICLVENEGNGRMCTSVPDVHIAIMGMERIVRDWSELDLMLGLLARSATGQALSVYTNIITGPRREGDVDGPREVHVVVLDNGRSRVLGTKFQEALHCIRCGACLNVCPVYRQVGGHAYGSVYAGPIGAVLTPLLRPDDHSARELAEASTLCGACWEACPVRIPLHDLLLDLRQRDAALDAGWVRRGGVQRVVMGLEHPGRLRHHVGGRPGGPRRGPPAGDRATAAGLGRGLGPGPGGAVTAASTAKATFLARLRTAIGPGAPAPARPFAAVDGPPDVVPAWTSPTAPLADRWAAAFEALGGQVHRTGPEGVGAAIAEATAGRGPVLVDGRFGRRIDPRSPDRGASTVEGIAGRAGVAGMARLWDRGRGHGHGRRGRGHGGHRRHRHDRGRQRPDGSPGQPVAPGRRVRPAGGRHRGPDRRRPPHPRRALAGRTAHQRRAPDRAVPVGRYRDAARSGRPRARRGPRRPGRLARPSG